MSAPTTSRAAKPRPRRSSRPFPTARRSSTSRASPAPVRRSTATRACTTSWTARTQYKIVFEQTANFNRAEALSVTEAGLAANGKPDVIVCANDDMALGAIEAVAAAGLTT